VVRLGEDLQRLPWTSVLREGQWQIGGGQEEEEEASLTPRWKRRRRRPQRLMGMLMWMRRAKNQRSRARG
jgi:hypothetical protein